MESRNSYSNQKVIRQKCRVKQKKKTCTLKEAVEFFLRDEWCVSEWNSVSREGVFFRKEREFCLTVDEYYRAVASNFCQITRWKSADSNYKLIKCFLAPFYVLDRGIEWRTVSPYNETFSAYCNFYKFHDVSFSRAFLTLNHFVEA